MQEYDADLDELIESHRSNRAAVKGGPGSGRGEPGRRLLRVVATVLVSLAVLAGAVLAYLYLTAPATLAATLPDNVGGFPAANVLSGEDALKSTESMHVGKIGRPISAVIGSYGPTTSVWLMSYANTAQAQAAVVKMARKMAKFGKGFQKIKTLQRGGVKVYVTRPGGAPQYFWSKGRVVGYIVPGEMLTPQTYRAIDNINRSLFFYELRH